MRIAVIGAGGVGGYFGGRLALAGNDVQFLARGKHFAAMRDKGLRIESSNGTFDLAQPNVTDDPAQLQPADVVLVTVKLWDLAQTGRNIAAIVGPATVVVPFQNGVEAVDLLSDGIPRARIAGGVAYIAATISSPGVIATTGAMAKLRFGPLIEAQRPALEALNAACKAADFDADIPLDIRRTLWEKFVFLNALSGVTSVSRLPVGGVRTDPDLRATIETSMVETMRLANAVGIALSEGFVAAQMQFLDTLPATMRSSMQNDLAAGNRLEAPWLCGAVARMYAERGSSAPINRTLYAALKPYIGGTAD
ncbi:MAG: 2-dehydropantoate 2-reductase [Betaproteobacteria bacterium]